MTLVWIILCTVYLLGAFAAWMFSCAMSHGEWWESVPFGLLWPVFLLGFGIFIPVDAFRSWLIMQVETTALKDLREENEHLREELALWQDLCGKQNNTHFAGPPPAWTKPQIGTFEVPVWQNLPKLDPELEFPPESDSDFLNRRIESLEATLATLGEGDQELAKKIKEEIEACASLLRFIES